MKVRAALILALVLAVVLLMEFATAAQRPSKVWRIGYLSVATAEFDRIWLGAFRDGLRDLGYVEGQTVVIEQRHAAGRYEALPNLVAEFADLRVDVIVIYAGPPGIRAVAKAIPTIPIVFPVAADPVGDGLVASLARPGGQITGLTDAPADSVPKRLELLKAIVPSATRIAVLLNPTSTGSLAQWKIVQRAAPAMGLTPLPAAIKGPGPEDIDRAFATIETARPDALFVLPEPAFGARQQQIAELATAKRLPAIGTVRQWAENGLLISYGANLADLWRRAATYVDKILKGAKPGDLPVEQPTKFELVFNLKTARALGLTIPPSLLLRADQVIE